MTRGMVQFTNKELDVLKNILISSTCEKESLVTKLAPESGSSTPNTAFNVLISEDEAEIMLDCMPIPNKDDDPNLVSARIKIQQFIADARFGDQE